MSYNIDTFKVKKLDGLTIPVASLFKHEREDWHPERKERDGAVRFCVCDSFIQGIVEGDLLLVDKIQWHGEGSGTGMNWILEPALKDSSGELIASCVWEGGDAINQLRVKDGKVEWVDIEI